MNGPQIVDTLDVSDTCADFDIVAASEPEQGEYFLMAFEAKEDYLDEVLVDFEEYPAVVELAQRSFDVDAQLTTYKIAEESEGAF